MELHQHGAVHEDGRGLVLGQEVVGEGGLLIVSDQQHHVQHIRPLRAVEMYECVCLSVCVCLNVCVNVCDYYKSMYVCMCV